MRSVWRPAPIIEAWLELLPATQAQAVRTALAALQRAAPALEPAVKWGNVVLQHKGSPVLALAPARRSLQLQVFHGAALARRFPMLEGAGPGPRALRWRLAEPADDELLGALAQAALALAQARTGFSPPPPPPR